METPTEGRLDVLVLDAESGGLDIDFSGPPPPTLVISFPTTMQRVPGTDLVRREVEG